MFAPFLPATATPSAQALPYVSLLYTESIPYTVRIQNSDDIQNTFVIGINTVSPDEASQNGGDSAIHYF